MKRYTHLAISCSLLLPANAAVLWNIGVDDNAQDGNGDPANGLNDPASFNGVNFNVSGARETGLQELPGNPANIGGVDSDAARDVDDDYYFAGVYTTVVDGGDYTPVGVVSENESYYDRAFTGGDRNMRWHFNVPETVSATDVLTFTIDFYNLNEANAADDSSFDMTFWVDGAQVGGMQRTRDTDFDDAQSWDFTLAELGGAAQQGPGFDHYVEIRSSVQGSARWSSLDYAQLEVTSAVPEPSSSLYFLSLAGLGFFYRRRR
ncbi:PEP-CTERM sorting domain-containing protein [Akkermansiaceae bacterium]|nr:PEP-CTERM sorting domain-containing protein [Akkermansiaceae bacterium]MDA7892121.1 PEP-CTERM sorting domain-containing protein [Akkermansiaceae bacterium]MDA7930524.1 PEP-CTERM sorting domain-containing protein [Akkermansiaceae bacterium]MDB4484260.1 PEP-CTERM sorting domain-containing protein [bacterium]